MSDAYYCQECGRYESDGRECPSCGVRGQRVSRFEWFLADALDSELDPTGRHYEIREQWPMADHRGFCWYWDLRVFVAGDSLFRGYFALIEVNGSDHYRQRKYSGAGGGYTRDEDKHYEAFSNLRLHKYGYGEHVLTNEQCRRKGGAVRRTAKALAVELIHLADTRC